MLGLSSSPFFEDFWPFQDFGIMSFFLLPLPVRRKLWTNPLLLRGSVSMETSETVVVVFSVVAAAVVVVATTTSVGGLVPSLLKSLLE